MKILFISDIHGSLYYGKKGIEAFHHENADYLVLLGDELYHGPRNSLPKDYDPKEVANLLNSYADRIIAVRGNCDSEVDQMMLSFPIMSDYSTILYNDQRLFLTHGHIYNEANLPKLNSGDVVFYGHTHVNKIIKREGIVIINLASIALPKEDNPYSYGILEDNKFTIKDIEGDIFKEVNIGY